MVTRVHPFYRPASFSFPRCHLSFWLQGFGCQLVGLKQSVIYLFRLMGLERWEAAPCQTGVPAAVRSHAAVLLHSARTTWGRGWRRTRPGCMPALRDAPTSIFHAGQAVPSAIPERKVARSAGVPRSTTPPALLSGQKTAPCLEGLSVLIIFLGIKQFTSTVGSNESKQ